MLKWFEVVFEKSVSDSCISSCQACQRMLSPRGSWTRSILPCPSAAYMPLSLGVEHLIFPSVSINCWGLAALFASLWSVRMHGTAKRAKEKRPNGSRRCRYKMPAWRRWRIYAICLSFSLWRDLELVNCVVLNPWNVTNTSLIWDHFCQFFQWFTQLVTLTFGVWSRCC